MMMPSSSGGSGIFGFSSMVEQEFAFITAYGFVEIEKKPTLVRYRSGEVELNIYHGRSSYEIGVQMIYETKSFSLSEIIRASDPAVGDDYRNPSAVTVDGLRSGIHRVADMMRRYGEQALRGDAEFYATLRLQKLAWSKAYALDVLAEQTRPKAEAAFREGRYHEAAELYEKISERLSPTERKKLETARRKS